MCHWHPFLGNSFSPFEAVPGFARVASLPVCVSGRKGHVPNSARDWINLDCWCHFSVLLGSTIRTKKHQVVNILTSVLEKQGGKPGSLCVVSSAGQGVTHSCGVLLS